MLEHDDTAAYITTEQLATRYGISPATIKGWRSRSRRGIKIQGPPWYKVPHIGQPYGAAIIRYRLADVLAWEQANGITPIDFSGFN